MTETEMREAKVPTPKTTKELAAYVNTLVRQPHDYGTCVYAMSMAAVAAFNHVADKLGVTGFQASCADLDIVRRLRRWDGPFMVVNLADHMYPQYDLCGSVAKAIADNAEWFRTEAAKQLTDQSEAFPAHPNVVAHWRRLAETPVEG